MLKPTVLKALCDGFLTLQKEIDAGKAIAVHNHHEKSVKIGERWYTIGTQDPKGRSAMAVRVRTGAIAQKEAAWAWTTIARKIDDKIINIRKYVARFEGEKVFDLNNSEIPPEVQEIHPKEE